MADECRVPLRPSQFEFLGRFKTASAAQAAQQGAEAKRAMLCVGMLCRYFDFDAPSAVAIYPTLGDFSSKIKQVFGGSSSTTHAAFESM